MGKVFWIVNVVILVAALALWGVGTLGVRGDARELKGRVDVSTTKIERLHRGRDKIITSDHIEAAKKLKGLLREEKEELKKVMRSHDLNVDKWNWGENPPPKGEDLALFHDWLEARYKEKNKSLSEAGITFPAAPGQADMRGEVKDWEDVTASDIPRLLREFVVMREISEGLTAAEAEVTYMVKKEGGSLGPEANTHKVDQLKLLEFGVRRRSGLRRAEAGPQEGKPLVTSLVIPRVEHVVTVRFVSHPNVVPDVMRRVERSKRILFACRWVTVRRPGQGGQGRRGERRRRYAPITSPPEEKLMRNAEDHEAPVEAEIRFGFFEFPVAREGQQ